MILFIIRHILLAISVALLSVFFSILFLFRPANTRNTYIAAISFSFICNRILGVKVIVENREKLKDLKNAVLISNHQSNYDIFLVGNIVPKNTVSVGKKAILYFPFFGMLYWLAGNILIDRANKKKAWSTMDKVVNSIKEGANVWIMPEGTRSKKRGLLPFKKGPFVVATKGEFPIYPICFSSYSDQLNLRKWKAGIVRINVLDPIDSKKYGPENIVQLKDDARDLIQNEVNRLDSL